MAGAGHRARLPRPHDRRRALRLVPDRLPRGAAIQRRRAAPVPQARLPADRDPSRLLSGGERARGRALPRLGVVMDARELRELELLAVTKLYGLAAGGDRSAVAQTRSESVDRQPPTANLISSMTWDQLRAAVASCTACGLCKQRKQAVFGVGAESGPWLFIGEGTGAHEDGQGQPFVGQAGKAPHAPMAPAVTKRRAGGYN